MALVSFVLPALRKRANLAVSRGFALAAPRRLLAGAALFGLLEPVAVALDLDDFGAVDEPVDQGDGVQAACGRTSRRGSPFPR